MCAPLRARARGHFTRVFTRAMRGKNIIFIFYIYFSVDTVDNVYKRHSTKTLSVN